MTNEFQQIVEEFRPSGFALHYLHPREKRPIGDRWSEAPVLSVCELLASYRQGNNIGVRLGEPSAVAGGYLHVLDIDIRDKNASEDAWTALRSLLPDVDVADLPVVQSGSGGESRHLYFITDKPFRSKRLWTSPGKHRQTKGGKDVWSYDAEIELFGTGKQVAMPPSIHPESGKPYIWLREFDFAVLNLGIGPFVPSSVIEKLAVAEHATYEFETREPLTFTDGQLERHLDAIPVSDLHYDDWIKLGQALHHQFGGSDAGFDLWVLHTKRSSKFGVKETPAQQLREMRRVKWKSFGRYRGKPVTMASVIEWAKDARIAELRASFDDEDDDYTPAGSAEEIDDIDAIGGDTPVPSEPTSDMFDDILGGDEAEPEEAVDDIDAIGEAAAAVAPRKDHHWTSLLQVSDKGFAKNLHNIELIVKNDPRLIGLPRLNEFTGETVQRSAPGHRPNKRKNQAKDAKQLGGKIWQVRDSVNGDPWSSARDHAVRSILEAPQTQGGYGITVTDRDLNAATVLSAWDNAFHPVREYLHAATWDGTPRVERLFIDYLGAPDNPYYRDVARLMMVAAVARVFKPGCKWDTAVILEGAQGRRKSTFIRTLGRRWFSELDGNFHDSKEMVEKMQGSWILEMPELNGFVKSEVQSIKAFISRQTDKVRLAYERRATDFPRQSILIGSTNDREYLKDNTGGRRFLPVECRVESIDIDGLRAVVDQLWGEAYAVYQSMMRMHAAGEDLPLYLTDEFSVAYAAKLQESRRVESPDDVLAGRIEEWLEKPINTGSIDDDGADPAAGPAFYNEVCTQMIWVECLGGDIRSFKPAEQGQVNRAMGRMVSWGANGDQKRFPKYGKQRVFYRGGEAGKLKRMGLSNLL
ncbi:MAG: VapE family protein [Sphingomonas phyllosphaerae]|uniref:VapE domain-containing protein n=1 Tax=Sphingomonas phyllosphaerae TaxID=257003 RepID=UPI002FFCE66C